MRVWPPTSQTTWRNGPVSSSRTGFAPNSFSYHGTLRSRSLTVSATWVMVGNSAWDASWGLQAETLLQQARHQSLPWHRDEPKGRRAVTFSVSGPGSPVAIGSV